MERDAAHTVTALRGTPGKNIAIFGGGELLRSLLAVGLVDRVEVSVVPLLLGDGVPLLPSPAERTRLKLCQHRVYVNTGSVTLHYEVIR
jgi:dihydrofolate reductase